MRERMIPLWLVVLAQRGTARRSCSIANGGSVIAIGRTATKRVVASRGLPSGSTAMFRLANKGGSGDD